MAGWNRPGEAPKKAAKKPSPARGVIAGVLVVALAAGAYFAFFAGTGEKPQKAVKEKSPSAIKEVTPAPAPKAKKPQPAKKAEAVNPDSKYGKLVSCKTNDAIGKVCLVFVDEKGREHKVYRPSRPPIFKHGTDQLLAMALCRSETHSAPPLPIRGNLDKQFLASLKEPIEISPDDPPEIAERKQTVKEARARMKEMMDQGGSFSEILADHERLFNENVKIRKDAARELQRIVDEGDTEGTREYLLRVNMALQQMGIKELEEPMSTEQRRAESARRHAE